VEAWTPTDSTFAIPEGYTVEEMPMGPGFEGAEEEEGVAPAPAA